METSLFVRNRVETVEPDILVVCGTMSKQTATDILLNALSN